MNDDEYNIPDNNYEELNFANELDLQKELYNLKELKKELNNVVPELQKAFNSNDEKLEILLKHNQELSKKLYWYNYFFLVSDNINITQHQIYTKKTNKICGYENPDGKLAFLNKKNIREGK